MTNKNLLCCRYYRDSTLATSLLDDSFVSGTKRQTVSLTCGISRYPAGKKILLANQRVLCQGCISTFHGVKALNKLRRTQERKGNPSIKATESNEDHTLCLFLTREACNEQRERGRFVEDTRCSSSMHTRGVLGNFIFFLYLFFCFLVRTT